MIQQQETYFMELYRAGLRAASDIAKASLENAQRLHDQQLKAVRDALDNQRTAAQRISEAQNMGDMVAAQVRLTGMQAEQLADFWTRAWRTAGETQLSMLGQVQSHVGELSERVREGYSMGTRATAENAANTASDLSREAEKRQAQQPHRKSA